MGLMCSIIRQIGKEGHGLSLISQRHEPFTGKSLKAFLFDQLPPGPQYAGIYPKVARGLLNLAPLFGDQLEEETNVPVLHRIWICFQGASMGASGPT